MRLFSDTLANQINPNPVTPEPGHDTKDGHNTSRDDFYSRDVWRSAIPAGNNPPSTFHGLGFSGVYWDFRTVNTHGHPILRGLGGQ
jgi:hypothetical protein